jgi:hypothetical protein
VESVSWDEFLKLFRWNQDEHVSLIGSTGCGKTTVARQILSRRRFVLALATKPRDPIVQGFRRDGFAIVRHWDQYSPQLFPKALLWPKVRKMEDIDHQREQFRHALNFLFETGHISGYADELQYITDARYCGLSQEVELLHQQGRALRCAFVGATQRPSRVPLTTYSEPSHLFLWQTKEESDVKRIRSMGGAFDSKEVQKAIQQLPSKHHFLYLNADSRQMLVSKADQV